MANLNVIVKTVADAATAEVLGTAFQKFRKVIFVGVKGDSATNNTSTAHIQLRKMETDGSAGDWVNAMPVAAGGWSAGINRDELEGLWDASQIRIKVGTNGDGVVAIVGS